MCFSSGGTGVNYAEQSAENERQIAAQTQLTQMSLQQQQAISDAQQAETQREFDYTVAQNTQKQTSANEQAQRQTEWDQSRTANQAAATQSISNAFKQFSPDYFSKYAQDYYGQASSEIDRQYGYAKKDLAFGLARSGNLQSTTGAEQLGKLAETKGRAEVDQQNAGQTAAQTLQQQVATKKEGLLSQALSSDTLGSPVAGDNSQQVSSAIDSANRAVSTIGDNARNYTATVSPVSPSLGTLSGLFSGVVTSGANYLSGRQDAAAYGGANPGATGLTGGSYKIY